ncbi:16S rRNA (adenine(1518)-N(6)/adenine(1519)-N(6))-dimethyltransferase RsmA [Cesiribacter andamanensis]|uniref:Ribosomal RNA small subunit methyltransferase A n=1 Tax=Cesiribacter andamanensis AMV16 TaxID=1279009 RepID=M7NW88_9BACT|nr:16S rRNA (adenine(1518)-N(6)/adenine(1519)-N(6))-dimethyltransferase RsmA [Cesiribacter andamanensis]EMR02714.1 Ribosomal RNA small subunit methyltransferase A [Cesiribacter andamanensis AMV16]
MKEEGQKVRPKKQLGQHFLHDQRIARNIVGGLSGWGGYQQVLEVGPGMGVLTQYLVADGAYALQVVELDSESVTYLNAHYPALEGRVHYGDFLKLDLRSLMGEAPFALIGNFPYNISSQIFFKVLEHRQQIPEVVGMVQKEVAQRIAEPPGSKTYGILSVLLQAFYSVEYLFTVAPGVFTPPPKVQSAVLRLRRNERQALPCNEKLFFTVVKQGFNNRRKTLRNSLKPLNLPKSVREWDLLDKRAEQLSVDDFIRLTQAIEAP